MNISFWETKAFSKDLDSLSKDKNCKKIDFRKKILEAFERVLRRTEPCNVITTIDNVIILKNRLGHPCLRKGKSGGLRLFWGISKGEGQQEKIHIIFIRLIYKAKRENLSEEEIEEALNVDLTKTIEKLSPDLIPIWLLKIVKGNV